MDYEKLYNESLERAKNVLNGKATDREPGTSISEYIFPVLKELEEEKIRKELVEYLKHYSGGDNISIKFPKWIAWLEQCEQKPTDKVEQKFKVGCWIVSNVSHEDYRICKILKIENGEYVIESIYGYQGHNNFEAFDKDYRLWTLKDAKDGDVLCVKYGNDEMPFIFTGKQDDIAYCALNSFGEFVLSMAEWLLNTTVLPATKEQRELLFQKMKEAGYEWDSENKELNKIEDKPIVIDEGKAEMDYCFTKMMNGEKVSSSWSEEDEENFNQLHKLIVEKAHRDYEIDTDDETLWGKYAILDNWLKSLKQRILG